MLKKTTAILAAITLSCSALPAMELMTENSTGTMLTASATGSMTFDQFFNTYNGVPIDYDGSYGVQCVDLVAQYIQDVIGVSNYTLNAIDYYNSFYSYPFLYNNFTLIANTPSFVPQKGDIMVWNGNWGGGYGHVGVCNGVGDTTYFQSYEENYGGYNEATALRTNSYSNVLGVLRPNDQSNIGGGSSGSGYNGTTSDYGTVWVNNDTYTFTENLPAYKDVNMNQLNNNVNTVYSGDSRTFVAFYPITKNGNSYVVGKTQAGSYIPLCINGSVKVLAYVKKNGVGSWLQVTQISGNYGYTPTTGEWLNLANCTG